MKQQFSAADARTLGCDEAYQGFFKINRIKLVHRLFAGGESAVITRELFERGESVGVLLYDPHRQLIGLAEQFRIGALADKNSPWLYEIVAGMIDGDDSPEQSAMRELQEETGLTDVELQSICSYWVSPGGTNEKMHLFCGLTNLQQAGGNFGCQDESEDICFHVVPEQQAFEMLISGKINNAASIIALQWLQLHKTTLFS